MLCLDIVKKFKSINVYDYTIAALAVCAAIGLYYGFGAVSWQLVLAPITALALDYLAYRFLKGRDAFPKSGLITGLIISLVIYPSGPLSAVAAAALAIAAKHLVTYMKRPIFNPAAFGLLASAVIFQSSDSWWAAGLSISAPASFIAAALAIAAGWKIGKLPITLAFLAGTLLVSAAYLGPASLLNAQMLAAVLGFSFFAGIMLTDPKTSCYSRNALVAQGIFVVAFNLAFGYVSPSLPFSIDGILVALLASNLLVPAFNRFLPVRRQPAAQMPAPA